MGRPWRSTARPCQDIPVSWVTQWLMYRSRGAWIFCGYLFGLLGGLLGIAIGAMLIQSKAKDAYGNKVQKYTSGSRWHGFAILLLNSIMFSVVTQMTG